MTESTFPSSDGFNKADGFDDPFKEFTNKMKPEPAAIPALQIPPEQFKNRVEDVAPKTMTPEQQTVTLSIIGIIIAFAFPLIGVILNSWILSQAKKNNTSTGLAITGIVIGVIFTLLGGLFFFGALIGSTLTS